MIELVEIISDFLLFLFFDWCEIIQIFQICFVIVGTAPPIFTAATCFIMPCVIRTFHMNISESFSTRTTTICGLIDASSLSPVTKALFPSVDPVFTKRISPLAIFISGDSSYFSRVIYVFLHSMVKMFFTILVALKVQTPSASFVTISLSVDPLNPILPLRLQVSPNLRCSQSLCSSLGKT